LKVLIVSTYDYEGGAARGAYRLHKALNKMPSVECKMVVQQSIQKLPSIIYPSTKWRKVEALVRPYLDGLALLGVKKTTNDLLSFNVATNSQLVDIINDEKPDIVNLHWINKGFLSLTDASRIQAEVVWTLHDSWLFTGGCHVPHSCGQYIDECSDCPKINPAKFYNPILRSFGKKLKYFQSRPANVVAVSHWLKDCADKSAILKDQRVTVIPNTLDTNVFRPLDKKFCKDFFDLDGRKVICFGAMWALDDKNKGYELLLEALAHLDCNEYQLLMFGNDSDEIALGTGFKVTLLGNVFDESFMSIVYNAADVFVMPSFSESFGQTAAEALSCGTPVVCFETTGLIDVVEHKQSGYLAAPFESSDLAKGIIWSTSADVAILSTQARGRALQHFSYDQVGIQYLFLFDEILENRNACR
jgi:glycosyltransferase involved in cell wall biosynthesis